jgi:hypothetical protein
MVTVFEIYAVQIHARAFENERLSNRHFYTRQFNSQGPHLGIIPLFGTNSEGWCSRSGHQILSHYEWRDAEHDSRAPGTPGALISYCCP